MRRLMRYLPPEQLSAVNLLLRQKNKKVESALEEQQTNLFEMNQPVSVKDRLDTMAWIHYYRPVTGEEWYCSNFVDFGMRCLYYCGEFVNRDYDIDWLVMKPGMIFDIFWKPVTFRVVMENHICCEDVKCKRIDYVSLMRGAKH